MAKGIKRQLSKVLNNVNHSIYLQASDGGFFGAAMATEGYMGGYADALMDIQLALNDVKPQRRDWWNNV